MKVFKSLHIALVIRYTVFFVISMAAMVATVTLFLAQMIDIFESDDLNAFTSSIYIDGNYKDGTMTVYNPPDNMVWYDVVIDGQVVYSEGERGIDKHTYSIDELNVLMNIDKLGVKAFGYEIDVHLHAFPSGELAHILFARPFSSNVEMGVNVPDEFKGTSYGDKLIEMEKVLMTGVLLSLSVVVGFFSLLTYRTLIKPIRKLNKGLLAIKQGELSTRVDYSGFTELSEMTEAFNVMAERLERAEAEGKQLSESKKELLMNISHDLRTPATIVQGYAQALSDGVVPLNKQQEYYRFIHDKAAMITERLNQMFNYVKVDVTHFDLNMTPTDISEFLRRLAINYLPDLESKEMVLNLEVEDHQVIKKIDVIEMERALGNLIENAVKYNPVGTKVTMGLYVESDKVRLEISDNGIGIPQADTKRIFDAFVRGDRTRKSEGTGLGLAITKQIIELHGGSITLLKAEQGSVFEIVF